MKIFILKLIALGVLLGGAWLAAVEFNAANWDTVTDAAFERGYELPEPHLILLGLSVVMIVFGFYGLLPAFGKRVAKRTITFEGEHGDVVIQLDPVQATLTRVLLNMPEIKRVSVRVDPDESGKNAIIFADALLQNQPGVSARDTARAVTDYIAESAKSLLGLEDLANIRLNVTGIHLNPKASSKAVRDSQAHKPGPPMQLGYSAATNEADDIAPLSKSPIVDDESPTQNNYTTVDIKASPSTDADDEDDAAEDYTPEEIIEDLPEVDPALDAVETPAETETHRHNLGGFDDGGEEVTSSAFADGAPLEEVDAAAAADELDNAEAVDEAPGETLDSDAGDTESNGGDKPEEKRGWKLFG